ncbi:MAG: hypothetical protein IJS28_08355 [Synergistaceae bacterium]|nr:hypothetical protein [Synergistaceae bacterium]
MKFAAKHGFSLTAEGFKGSAMEDAMKSAAGGRWASNWYIYPGALAERIAKDVGYLP